MRKRNAYVVDTMVKQKGYESGTETEPATSPPPSPLSPLREDRDEEMESREPSLGSLGLSLAEQVAFHESQELYDYRAEQHLPNSFADFLLEWLVARTAYLHKIGKVGAPLMQSVVLAVNKLRLDPEFLPSMTPEQRDALLRADVAFRPGTFEKDHGLGVVATGVAYEDRQYGLYIANLPRMPYLDPEGDIVPKHIIDGANALSGEALMHYGRFLYNTTDKSTVGACLATVAGMALGVPGVAAAGAGAVLRFMLTKAGYGKTKSAVVTGGIYTAKMATDFHQAKMMALKWLGKEVATRAEIVDALRDIMTTMYYVADQQRALAQKVISWNHSGAFDLYLTMTESATTTMATSGGFLGAGSNIAGFLFLNNWYYNSHRMENFLSFNTKDDAYHWVGNLTKRINELYTPGFTIAYEGNRERCRRLLLHIERTRRTISTLYAPPSPPNRTLKKQAEDVSKFITAMRRFERFYKRFAADQGILDPEPMVFSDELQPEEILFNAAGEYVGDGWHLNDDDPNNSDNHDYYGPYDHRAVVRAGRRAARSGGGGGGGGGGGPPPPPRPPRPPRPAFPGAPGYGRPYRVVHDDNSSDDEDDPPPPPPEGGNDNGDNDDNGDDDDDEDEDGDDGAGVGIRSQSDAQADNRRFPGPPRPGETDEEWGARMEAWLNATEDEEAEEAAPLSSRLPAARKKSKTATRSSTSPARRTSSGKAKAPPIVVDASVAGGSGSVVDRIFARLKL